MAQTAVEWLVKELQLDGYDFSINKAKQMEKLQIMKAWMDIDTDFERKCAEQYYNETYGK